tara:strand:- start:125 stop:556 length:432 start_codon:yes stop_codon:yes gene_type:complete
MKNIILCDIDGTVANNYHRQHFLEGKKDWDGFFSELINDKPINKIISILYTEVEKGSDIIFITGRPERYRYSSNLWLKQNFSFDYKLYMRKNGDQRNKLIIKKEIFMEYCKDLKIILCIDNDEELIRQWNELGLKTINAEDFY